eukprot:TRINITY_DN433_c0_g1_i1.p1 TRINITY_DN433_c0_g1~~TRINITY_DN433_c0_g1_i1.p1  ORF type:complete len:667 (+),score=175.10 TRINITY_DN433_c0_g1_i1:156-2156(+)
MIILNSGIKFSSDFEHGNLSNAIQITDDEIHCYTTLDAKEKIPGENNQNASRCWFYFSVEDGDPDIIYRFVMVNLNHHAKIYSNDMRPVYKYEEDIRWKHLPNHIEFVYRNIEGVKRKVPSYKVQFKNPGKYYIAFTFPWSVNDSNELIDYLQHNCSSNVCIIPFELCKSKLNQSITTVAVINANDRKTRSPIFEQALFEPGVPSIDKPVVFLSARVHPGETPSSFILNGFLKFIVTDDPRAIMLRKHFQFRFIPVVNPDGVSLGYYRHDSSGKNLNRFYSEDVTEDDSPEIFTIRRYLSFLHQSFDVALYLDLHAHARKRGIFMYGNYMPSSNLNVQSMYYPALVAKNSPFFELEQSVFTENILKIKDRTGASRECSGRVGTFKALQIVHAYTLECSYNCNYRHRTIAEVPNENIERNRPTPRLNSISKFTPFHYEHVGESLAVSILDLFHLNEFSRISKTSWNQLLGDLRAQVRSIMSNSNGISLVSKEILEENLTKLYLKIWENKENLLTYAKKKQNFSDKTLMYEPIFRINEWVENCNSSKANFLQSKKNHRIDIREAKKKAKRERKNNLSVSSFDSNMLNHSNSDSDVFYSSNISKHKPIQTHCTKDYYSSNTHVTSFNIVNLELNESAIKNMNVRRIPDNLKKLDELLNNAFPNYRLGND